MSIPEYRELTDLTDDEIYEFFHVLDAGTVQHIERHGGSDPYIDVELKSTAEDSDGEGVFEVVDLVTLEVPSFDDPGLSTHDFAFSGEECDLWAKFLLAKGVDHRLLNNPFLSDRAGGNE